MITEKVNGGLGLKYDTLSGAPNYAGSPASLRLANFLLFLNGSAKASALRSTGPNPFDVVNCLDCGSLVSAFGTVLGVDLKVTTIENWHSCNEILAIGREVDGWKKPFQRSNGTGGFLFHAFAGMTNLIWDACLKVGEGDPTSGGTRISPDGLLPTKMPQIIGTPASIGTPIASGGTVGNGIITVTAYDESGHRGIVPASATAICTAITVAGAEFTINCGRNGNATLVVPQIQNEETNCDVVKNGVKTLNVTIKQGTVLFALNDNFSFEILYDFNEYRSSLAAPDWDVLIHPQGTFRGRTPATTFSNRTLTLE